MSDAPIIVIVGPTASGKSGLAMKVAQKYDGEIICADSQTLRRDMDIGTAKPSKRDQELVVHHMIDIIGPYDRFSAAEFKRRAEKHISEIRARGRLSIVVGGTGLYIDALLFNYIFSKKADETLRKKLESKSVRELQDMTRERKIPMPKNDKNPRHLIRTIESGGLKATDKMQRPDAYVVGIDPSSERLKERIEVRAETMLNHGFADEVKRVVRAYGRPPADRGWDALGYATVFGFIQNGNETDSGAVVRALVRGHWQYARRQRSWFRRNKNIEWVSDAARGFELIAEHLHPS